MKNLVLTGAPVAGTIWMGTFFGPGFLGSIFCMVCYIALTMVAAFADSKGT